MLLLYEADAEGHRRRRRARRADRPTRRADDVARRGVRAHRSRARRGDRRPRQGLDAGADAGDRPHRAADRRFELLDRPDVPVAVVLDEAVELAKRFSTDDSGPLRQRRAVGAGRPVLRAECLDTAVRFDTSFRSSPAVISPRRTPTPRRSRRIVADETGEITIDTTSNGGGPGSVASRGDSSRGHGSLLPARCCLPSCSASSAFSITTTSAPGRTTWASTTRASGWSPRGGQTFMTVRGMEFWGHHLNLDRRCVRPVLLARRRPVVPLRRPGGRARRPRLPDLPDRPRPLRQAVDWPAVRRRLLMYAPIQWISWANFHPEALVIAPLLYAWWFATHRRWRGMFVALLIALSIREDTALVVIMFGAGPGVDVSPLAKAITAIGRWRCGRSCLGFGWYVVRHQARHPALQPGHAALLHRVLLQQLRQGSCPRSSRRCCVIPTGSSATRPSPTDCASTATWRCRWAGCRSPHRLALADGAAADAGQCHRRSVRTHAASTTSTRR